ncbi:MAG: GtrA family protein [Clostridiales bacterium]|nr:GtrA family protein [Clostridiales bacterium]
MKKIFKYMWDMYKEHEEGINYLIFGFLAFVINYLLFNVLETLMHMGYMVATALSWLLTVVFVYWTNRTFVFKSKNIDKTSIFKEFCSFIGARIATEVLEIVLMFLMVDLAHINSKIAKLIAQAAVIIANYILSKIWVFKESKNK